MGRLIEAEELKECIRQVKDYLAENLLDMPMKQGVLETVETFIGLVESMPTVDAVPVSPPLLYGNRYVQVVRCKDCKHWKNNIDADELTVCRLHGMFEGAWDYCSKAERKEE